MSSANDVQGAIGNRIDYNGVGSPVKILPPSVNFLSLTPHWTSLGALYQPRGPQWHLLPTTPTMLPTATKHFDRAG